MRDSEQAPAADVVEALRRVGGDRALLRELVDIFLEDLPGRQAELREALGAGDAARVERAAHGLGGSLAVLDARPAGRLAAELTALARGGRLAAAPAVLACLEAELGRVAAFLADAGWPGHTA